ncbi:alpha/beta hydrolase [Paeniglutamicibacter psychrophenolicus]|uniref:Pimeloyl-ACP methyl ester carboxylesterase n=1 Tax=Paeniglutamicibacter psychrophenolicus TaxID=257454 RepID=A0ABS4WHG0_9MICC|nr:alpha/beta hydrolase [Paeniglutamicibacter psychrophenolicus]MBP2375646.1 pimeloyl-ACP methyl ester carboxylesterase [Paeniglutamicibacter psychrophenolicus]
MKIHPDAQKDTLQVEGLEVPFYDTLAPHDTRETVVLIHGTGGSAATHFRTLYPMLAARYRVLALDLQTPAEGLTLEHYAGQVAAVIQKQSPGAPVHLLGYSLGALVASVVAANHEKLVRSLTLVAGWITSDNQQLLRNSIWGKLFETNHDLLREFVTFTAFSPAFLAGRSMSEVEQLVSSRVFPAGIAQQMELNRNADTGDVLGSIGAPTLVIAGRHDYMVHARQTQLLYGAIPDARYATIDSGHAIVHERPAQLFQIVNEFIMEPHGTPAGLVHDPIFV